MCPVFLPTGEITDSSPRGYISEPFYFVVYADDDTVVVESSFEMQCARNAELNYPQANKRD